MGGVSADSLVGRELEVKRLDRALDFLATGGPACVAIEGEPGIGKTRLLTELQRRAEARHHIVLQGRAAEFAQDVPFGVVVDTLDAYLGVHEANEIEAWDADVVEELAGIFPALRPHAPAGEAGLGEERYRAHRAVRWLLERLSLPRPLIIALDDVHWADAASIELIGALLRRGPAAPVLLALAFRSAQAPERLSAALAVPEVRRLELAPLSEAEATQLLGDFDAGVRDVIYREAGGNPFYLEQLVRAVGAGRSPGDPGGTKALREHGIPTAVTAALTEELDSLSPDARSLLESASVAGEPFEPDIAAEIAEQPIDEALVSLDELVSKDLVRATKLPRRFAFRHGLVHRAVYEATPGGWRLAAHERAARALSERGASAAERARHVEYAASQGDEESISVLLEAAEQTRSRAPAAAVHWFDAALRLLPAGETERQVEVRVSLAAALRAVGELERCRAVLLEAIELVPDEATEQRVQLTADCAAVENWLGYNDAAHRRLVRAWEELPARGGAAAAALAVELAIDGLYALDFDQARSMGEQALTAAKAIGDEPLIATATAALCLVEQAAGRVPAAQAYREQAAALIDRLTDEELAPRLEALYYLGWAETFLEHREDSLAHAERGIAISRATGDGRLIVALTLATATPLEGLGRLPEATEAAQRAVEAAQLTDNPQYLFWALWELGWRYYLAGDLDAAMDACERSERASRQLAGSFMRSGSGEPGWTMGLTLIRRGELERGLERMLAGVGGRELRNVIPFERCWARENLARAEIALGRIDDAEAIAAEVERETAALGLNVPSAIAARTRAWVALAKGDAEHAVECAERAVEFASGTSPLDSGWSRSLLGHALAAAGERDRAIAALREAEHELGACGSLRERDAARRELRRLGGRVEPRGRAAAKGASGLEALTKRELEIAELVADGKTNRAIAEELFLSMKTVESHLRNIFGKLDVSSRVAVARTVADERAKADG